MLRDRDKKYFPIYNIPSVLQLFKSQLERHDEPDLTLLSIVIGAIENSVTCNVNNSHAAVSNKSAASAKVGNDDNGGGNVPESFPTLDWRTVESLYNKFQTQIKGSAGITTSKTSGYATRELVKRVSDVIWSSLTRSCYKDRAHLQSLYSFLTGNKLDCFGVAFAVVAACQLLGYKDVHLALSEDHAWVVFGENSEETAEVTWHGKGNEDKRGQSISLGVVEKSWLYLNGHPVKCSRHMEVAAMVSSINPSVNATIDNIEIANLQQGLMWLLYDLGHLEHYPMALANLGDLEEIATTPGRLSCETLFHKAIESARSYYNNQHVYPYTYLGRYFYRRQRYKEALEAWANAAGVIKKFNYNREDEEIYKEFLEIANELIPNVIKLSCLSHSVKSTDSELLKDPECFGYLLRFYDSICKWEEGSCTPVLHIGWAKPLVNTISKFDAKVRSHVIIALDSQGEEMGDGNNNHEVEVKHEESKMQNRKEEKKSHQMKHDINENNDIYCDKAKVEIVQLDECDEIKMYGNGASLKTIQQAVEVNDHRSENSDSELDDQHSNHSYRCTPDFIKCLENQINPDEEPHPNIAALAAACSENILNPEYLLGSGEPFSSSLSSNSNASSLSETKVVQDYCDFFNCQSMESTFPRMTDNQALVTLDSPSSLDELPGNLNNSAVLENDGSKIITAEEKREVSMVMPKIILQSEKMKGLKDLLLAEKLNVSAIQLQLTAQSQVLVVKRTKSSATDFDFIGISCSSVTRSNKRSRRD